MQPMYTYYIISGVFSIGLLIAKHFLKSNFSVLCEWNE